MPGTNAGPGCPITFRCAKCRTSGRRWPTGSAQRCRRSGAKRKLRENRNARMMNEAHQYRCLDCGHVGWSRHSGVLDAAEELRPSP